MLQAKNKIGVGFSVTLKENKKTKQSEISKIYFETLEDFICFVDKENEFRQFESDSLEIITQIPELKNLLSNLPKIIVENHKKWAELLLVCHYFIQNPQPNLYVRNLPIDVSTKFIENNQSILRTLLDFLIGDKINTEETDFFRRLGLQIEEPSIKIRFLDSSLSFHQSISCLSVWVSEFNGWHLNCQKVFIIENLTTFLSFPKTSSSIAIWGGGFAVNLLKNANWLNNRTLYYWGDIDIHGFQILSQIRGFFSNVKSLMMDSQTLQKFHTGQKGGDYKIIEMVNLNIQEREFYEMIKSYNWRLEQEKIPLNYVLNAIHPLTVMPITSL